MSGGVTTYQVVDPMYPWLLWSRLHHAYATGDRAKFTARVTCGIPELDDEQELRIFDVTVTDLHEGPAPATVTDSEGRTFILRFADEEGKLIHVEFDVYS